MSEEVKVLAVIVEDLLSSVRPERRRSAKGRPMEDESRSSVREERRRSLRGRPIEDMILSSAREERRRSDRGVSSSMIIVQAELVTNRAGEVVSRMR